MNLGVELNAAEARSAPGRQTSGNWALFPPGRIECRLRIIPDPGKL
jgi:hypothetical protein